MEVRNPRAEQRLLEKKSHACSYSVFCPCEFAIKIQMQFQADHSQISEGAVCATTLSLLQFAYQDRPGIYLNVISFFSSLMLECSSKIFVQINCLCK